MRRKSSAPAQRYCSAVCSADSAVCLPHRTSSPFRVQGSFSHKEVLWHWHRTGKIYHKKKKDNLKSKSEIYVIVDNIVNPALKLETQ